MRSRLAKSFFTFIPVLFSVSVFSQSSLFIGSGPSFFTLQDLAVSKLISRGGGLLWSAGYERRTSVHLFQVSFEYAGASLTSSAHNAISFENGCLRVLYGKEMLRREKFQMIFDGTIFFQGSYDEFSVQNKVLGSTNKTTSGSVVLTVRPGISMRRETKRGWLSSSVGISLAGFGIRPGFNVSPPAGLEDDSPGFGNVVGNARFLSLNNCLNWDVTLGYHHTFSPRSGIELLLRSTYLRVALPFDSQRLGLLSNQITLQYRYTFIRPGT